MMTRVQIHHLIDELPESELDILARILEGLQATRMVPQSPQVAPPSPIRPVDKPIIPRGAGKNPLAHQYSNLLAQESPENQSLLRKVMFSRVSDLMAWVNQSGPNTPAR